MSPPTIVSWHSNDCGWFRTYRQGVRVTDTSLFHRHFLTLSKNNKLDDIHGVDFAFNRARKIGDCLIWCFPVLASDVDVRRVVHSYC